VPGIHIPDSVIARLEGAEDQKREGKRICVEIIQACKEIAGVSGVHVMAYRQEELVAEIVHETGVLRGRRPWQREPSPDDAVVAERLKEIRDERQGVDPDSAAEAASHVRDGVGEPAS
jgi:hypothetical protein